jgi:hypothetical protein
MGEIVEQEKSPAQQYHEWLINLKCDIAEKFLLLGKICRDINDQNLYIQHDCETFGEYLGSVGLDKSTVYRCIQLYEKFVEHYGLETKRLAQIGYSKLCDIVPIVDDKTCSDWVQKAESLSRSDLIIEIKGAKDKVASVQQDELVNCTITEVESGDAYGLYIPRKVLEKLKKQYS